MIRSVLILLMLLSPQAWGGIHKWVDENGETHYSDTVPPQIVNKATSELSRSGKVIRQTPAALTPEQRRIEAEAEAKERAEERRSQEQKRRDRALLDSYTSENDIDIARDRNLLATQALIDSTAVRAKSIKGRLDALEAQADHISGKGKPIPDDLADAIEAAKGEIKHLRDSIVRYKLDMGAIRERFERDKERYRELHTGKYMH